MNETPSTSFTICTLTPLGLLPTLREQSNHCCCRRAGGRTDQPGKRVRGPLRPPSLSLSPSVAQPRRGRFRSPFMVNSWRVATFSRPSFLPSFLLSLLTLTVLRFFRHGCRKNREMTAKKPGCKFGAKTGGKRVRRVERDTARDGAGRGGGRRPRGEVDKAEVRASGGVGETSVALWAQSVSVA